MPVPTEANAGPPWAVYGSSPAYLALQRGLAYFYLDRSARAVKWLSAGLTELPRAAGQSELFAGYRVQLAVAHARAGDPEQACSVAAQAVVGHDEARAAVVGIWVASGQVG